MSVTIFQMKCFLSLVKTRKMSTTAEQMGLSLSTLSKYITRMEDELSVPLFTKTLSRQVLTPEGELIYPSIEYIVKQYDDMCACSYRYTSRYESALSVVFGFHPHCIMRHIVAFLRDNPHIMLNVTEGSATDVCEMLDTGTADIGIVYEQFIDKKYPVTVPLFNDRLCAVVAIDHPLAKRQTISISELQWEKFFLYRRDYLMNRYLLHACIAAGFVPMVEHSDMRFSTILLNVEAGNGVTLIPESIVPTLHVRNIATLNLSENLPLTLCAVCASDYPDESRDLLLRYFQEIK